MVKYTGGGLVVKRPGVLSKVQMLTLVLGVGVSSLLPSTVMFEIITFLIQKHFQNGNGNGNFEKINSNDFLDGNWESMEMKGRLRGPRRKR